MTEKLRLLVTFKNLDDALNAMDELKLAGIDAELKGWIDDNSSAAFLGVSGAPDKDDALLFCEEVMDIVHPFDGWVDGDLS